MKAVNSERYRKKATTKRKIPDGLPSPAPMFPPKLKVKWKAEREAETKLKAQAEITISESSLSCSVLKLGRVKKRTSETQEAEASQETSEEGIMSAAKSLTADELFNYR